MATPTAQDLAEFEASLTDDLFRELFEAGDLKALFAAISACGSDGRALPTWAVSAFEARWDTVRRGNAMTLSDAFGPLYRKGTQHRTVRNTVERNSTVDRQVNDFRVAGDAIDVALQKAAETLNLSEGRTREIYYRARPDPHSDLSLPGWPW